jgi:hypothetical protein
LQGVGRTNTETVARFDKLSDRATVSHLQDEGDVGYYTLRRITMNRRAFFAWLWEMGVFVSLSRYLPWLKPVPQRVTGSSLTMADIERMWDLQTRATHRQAMALADMTWDVPAMSSANAILYDDITGEGIAFWWIVGPVPEGTPSAPEYLHG